MRFLALSALSALLGLAGQLPTNQKVDGYFLPTGQFVKPLGDTLTINARPVDMTVHPSGKWLYVKENRGLTVVDAIGWKIVQELSVPGGASYFGLTLNRAGTRIYFSNSNSTVHEGDIAPDGTVKWVRQLQVAKPKIGGESYPCGLLLSTTEDSLFVCASRGNEIQQISLDDGKLEDRFETDIAPYDMKFSADGLHLIVSCWGGVRPEKGAKTAKSAGTDVAVDEGGKATSGSLAIHDLANQSYRSVRTGPQPSEIAVGDDGTIFVANANNDSVSALHADFSRLKDFVVKPEGNLPFGSAPNALAFMGSRLLVACGGNNAIAVLDPSANGKTEGFFPTGWYPTTVRAFGNTIFVANAKGSGSRRKNATGSGFSVYNFTGSIQRISASELDDLTKPTADVKTLNATKQILEASVMEENERVEKDKKELRPIPNRLGEPSSIQHVVYVIKENRTYDQVFGDIKKGDGDPSLCVFGKDVTPNQHALADQFVLLDNYYCNGVNSADGHAWAVEGNATSHLERSFGGWTRSYPFGDDPLSVSASGFLWDNVLRWGKSFRNFGEFDNASEKPDSSWFEVYRDWKSRAGKIKFGHDIGVDRVKRYSNPDYPGWNMDIPDTLRASIFLKELGDWERKGQFPNLTILYLPQDHTSGTAPGNPTPRAMVAENDLAVGQVVEGLSKSKFWKKMAIFVIEDDPQAGFDHVDGHRSTCLVVSPYTRTGKVVKQFYNQTSVLRTMQFILGVPPMNQMDARSPLMSACFTERANYAPFKALANRVPVDEQNPIAKALDSRGRALARFCSTIDFRRPDQLDEVEEHKLNRAIWYSVRGQKPYPSKFSGAHGRGLAKRGLKGKVESDD
jgi:DNA-binding beta-propeller fold protein YncE